MTIFFEGVYPAIVTPLTDSDEVDYKRLKELCNWLIDEGVDGLVPVGGVGEYAVFTVEERKGIVETVMEVARGRVPVIVGCAAPSTKEVVGWTQHAKDLGAAGVMALPPEYDALKNEIIAHYQAISDVGLPIVIYNSPVNTPVDLTPDFIEELAKIENIVAVKDFSGDIRRTTTILENTNLEVIVGIDDLVVEGATFGATGWIAGLPNALPKESMELFRLSREGKLEEALKLYRRLLPLLRLDANPQLVQSIKHMVELAWKPVGATRPPRLPLSKEELDKIKEAYDFAVK